LSHRSKPCFEEDSSKQSVLKTTTAVASKSRDLPISYFADAAAAPICAAATGALATGNVGPSPENASMIAAKEFHELSR
jgi:hypothetical protein